MLILPEYFCFSFCLHSPPFLYFTCSVTDRLEVTLEITSNWGHSGLVGLTELQVFDQSGVLVPVKPSDVSVHGARGQTGKVDVLFNGKSKVSVCICL